MPPLASTITAACITLLCCAWQEADDDAIAYLASKSADSYKPKEKKYSAKKAYSEEEEVRGRTQLGVRVAALSQVAPGNKATQTV